MMGRGMVTNPGLALSIKGQGDVPWAVMPGLLLAFWQQVGLRVDRRHRAGRLKQWLNYLRRHYPQAQQAFDELRLTNDADAIQHWFDLAAAAPLIGTAAQAANFEPWAEPLPA
jgi:tRNA-dihydrouridine synthase C